MLKISLFKSVLYIVFTMLIICWLLKAFHVENAQELMILPGIGIVLLFGISIVEIQNSPYLSFKSRILFTISLLVLNVIGLALYALFFRKKVVRR